jgi:microcystin-dependent protein
MATPFLSEIKIFGINFAPKGWALCNGQLLSINQNQALFSLLGTTYGGDGIQNFALPNLQGRAPVHMGNGIVLGEKAGESVHTLTIPEMPEHAHQPVGSSSAATVRTAAGNLWATDAANNPYSPTANGAMSPAAVTQVGGSQAHQNMSPYLTLTFCIALTGIFPSQN